MVRDHDPAVIRQLLMEYNIDCFENTEELLPYLSAVRLERKDRLSHTYDLDRKLVFYLKGSFKIYSETESGEGKLLRNCRAPMLLGDMELLRDVKNASLTVEATTGGLALVLDYPGIRERLFRDSRFLKYTAEALAEKLEYFGRMETRNELQSAEEKVFSYLLSNAGDAEFFKGNLRTAAEELSISYRHLHRTLAVLEKKEKIIRKEHRIFILPPGKS